MIHGYIGTCRVLEEIGSGGMAVVMKAVQEPLGRTVAIKALKPSIAIDSQFAKRFEREALFMASLQHENILHVYEFIKDEQSMYIVMEYVRGTDLYDLLERTARVPPEIAAIIALQIARALDYAHFRGIIHRDIKPANVMISNRGEVKLMDFGIARTDALTDLTETGTGLGTPSYMSPEQILGDKLDFRSDVFSLGIVMYQMVTGNKPFVEDEARTVMQKIRLDRYTSARRLNPIVPRSLERIMSRCMEKVPANRYPSTQALVDDLNEYLATRVSVNRGARMVAYLRDVGVVSELEAQEVLGTAAVRESRFAPKMTTRTAATHAALGLAALGAVFSIPRPWAAADQSQPAWSRPAEIQRATARVYVLADPWAHVHLDGVLAATTPTARPIEVAPGKHFLRFTNPHTADVLREINPAPGEVLRIGVTMKQSAPTPPVNPEQKISP